MFTGPVLLTLFTIVICIASIGPLAFLGGVIDTIYPIRFCAVFLVWMLAIVVIFGIFDLDFKALVYQYGGWQAGAALILCCIPYLNQLRIVAPLAVLIGSIYSIIAIWGGI